VTDAIAKLAMPKWGLSMTEGRLTGWLVDEGVEIAVGAEVAEVETEKINGTVESPVAGVLRRRVAQENQVIPVGGLLGVIATADVSDEEIDAFVTRFEETFVPDDGDDGASGGSAQSETVSVGAGQLRVVVQGEGETTLLLLHGFGGDAENWQFNLDALATGRLILAPDLPGHGSSTKDVGTGLATLVEAATDLLDARDVGQVHVIGHSLGGLVASELALRTPERVASLTLVAPAGFGPEINRDYIDGFVAAESRRDLKPTLQMLFADESLVTRQLVDEVLRYKRLDGVSEALGLLRDELFLDGRQSRVIAKDLETVDMPLLVVWGAQDRVLPAAQVEQAPANARVVVLDGAGHSPQLEAAGEFNRVVVEFLGASG
jgi:pyruvate dehydrogenase E2 component (dihydrolipoyllysine-residue acetyltransferase)